LEVEGTDSGKIVMAAFSGKLGRISCNGGTDGVSPPRDAGGASSRVRLESAGLPARLALPADGSMSRYTKAAWAELTSYEAEQVRQIAAWKSEPPNPFAELFKKLTLPGAWWLGPVIPDRIVMAVARATISRKDEHRCAPSS
jgi:hypothetical protein